MPRCSPKINLLYCLKNYYIFRCAICLYLCTDSASQRHKRGFTKLCSNSSLRTSPVHSKLICPGTPIQAVNCSTLVVRLDLGTILECGKCTSRSGTAHINIQFFRCNLGGSLIKCILYAGTQTVCSTILSVHFVVLHVHTQESYETLMRYCSKLQYSNWR